MRGDLSWPLARAVRLHGDAVAVVEGDMRVSYAQLARRVGALGAALDALELAPGARVGFLGVNSLAHLEAWLGVPVAGRVLADLNIRLTMEELAFMVDDCEVELLIAGAEHLEVAHALSDRCPSLREVVADDGVHYESLLDRAPALPRPAGPDALATISYTGGTTGRAKGVMLSHGNLLSNALHNLVMTGHRADDTFLHVCPMFHIAGVANVFASTWVGARQVILPRFDAAAVAGVIAGLRVTLTTLVPTMLAMLLDHLDAQPADLSSLRNLHYAASPISPQLQRRLLATLDCEIAQMYGMTEAAPSVTHLLPEDHRRGAAGEEPYRTRLRSMGAPIAGVQAEVRHPDGRPAAPGEIGEIWVRGPNVMLGYWRRPEVTAEALVDGWYRSGDAAYADADGYMYMVDRLKDMIISGAENVYSIEVEEALLEHPAVREAAVFGVPHERWGEAVHAVVCVAETADLTADDLVSHCRGRIAGFKIPRSIDLRSEPLPKSGAGKLLKNVLREPHWAGRERRVS